MSLKILTPEQIVAYNNLNIRTYEVPEGIAGDRVFLCIDGGGIRGMIPIQLIKKMEDIAGIPCQDFCDIVAGTSTGAIIAGLLAAGRKITDIENLYEKMVTKVFQKRSFFANKFLAPAEYDKTNYRQALQDEIGDITMQQACQSTNLDLLITAKNVTDNEEIFFSCFNGNGGRSTYKDALLRTVMEATMSAPTYFSPLERFVDGGITAYNNPSLVAVIEALEYDGKGKYDADKLTIFSLGTGKTVQLISAQQAAAPDPSPTIFWLHYILDTAGSDASAIQSEIFRSQLLARVDYRRFQISLDPAAIQLLPGRDISDLHIVNADYLSDLTSEELADIKLDDLSKFQLIREIGLGMVDYIMQDNRFQKDLVAANGTTELLVTSFDDRDNIKQNVCDPHWINTQQSK